MNYVISEVTQKDGSVKFQISGYTQLFNTREEAEAFVTALKIETCLTEIEQKNKVSTYSRMR